MTILQAPPPPKALEARLYLDRALAVVNRDLSGGDTFEAEDVAVAFVDALHGNPRLLTMTIARGPAPGGRAVVVTTAEASVDAKASEVLLNQVLTALYGVVAFA
jgi:hypothetical protein